jgi:hypothetical protein
VFSNWQDQSVIHNDAITNAAFETRVDSEAITELIPRITDLPEGFANNGNNRTEDMAKVEKPVTANQPAPSQSVPQRKSKSTFRRIARRIVGPTLLTKK